MISSIFGYPACSPLQSADEAEEELNDLTGFDKQRESESHLEDGQDHHHHQGICTFTDIRDSMPCGALATVSFRKLVTASTSSMCSGDSGLAGSERSQWYIHKHRCSAHLPTSTSKDSPRSGDDGQGERSPSWSGGAIPKVVREACR